MAEQFTAVADFYDELMAGVPYKMWVRYIHEILDQLDFKAPDVLELACGTGTISFLMEDLGHRVVGVDGSPEMIRVARQKAEARGSRAAFFVQDLRALDLPKKDFDLALCLFDSFNYILEPEELALAFRKTQEHLRDGGLLIFDVNTIVALAGELFTQENTSPRAEPKYVWKSQFDPQTRICRVDMQFIYHGQEFREVHYQRAYDLDELELMLKKSGFHVLAAYDAYSFRRPLRRSDRVFFVARARKR